MSIWKSSISIGRRWRSRPYPQAFPIAPASISHTRLSHTQGKAVSRSSHFLGSCPGPSPSLEVMEKVLSIAFCDFRHWTIASAGAQSSVESSYEMLHKAACTAIQGHDFLACSCLPEACFSCLNVYSFTLRNMIRNASFQESKLNGQNSDGLKLYSI